MKTKLISKKSETVQKEPPPPLTVEVDLHKQLKKANKMAMISLIAGLALAFSGVAAGFGIVMIGKDKDKIIERDAAGRPVLLQIDRPDAIYANELEVFMKDTVPKVLNWDFAEVKDQDRTFKHFSDIAVYAEDEFMKGFYRSMTDTYLKSIENQRSLVRASVVSFDRVKIKNNKAMAVVNVDIRAIKIGAVEAVGEATEKRQYLIKVIRGKRNFENPFGLFVYHFALFSGDSDIEEFK